MQPAGQMILQWRNAKGLTQFEVARRSGVSRPNLSAIEQGARDLTVETLRRIALALGIKAGMIIDGIGPTPVIEKETLDRAALDRISRSAAGESVRVSGWERRVALDFALIMRSKSSRPGFQKKPGGARAENSASMRLKSEVGPKLFEHLIHRIEKHLSLRAEPHE